MKRLFFYLILVALIVGGIYYYKQRTAGNNVWSPSQYENAVSTGQVVYVDVYQNEEVPTGSAQVSLTDGNVFVVHTADVKELVTSLKESGINYNLHDIERPSWFASYGIELILIVVLCMFLFFTMLGGGAAGGGGGTNAKMMNFGKSRAQMILDVKTNFNNVAGLREEKEDLEELVDFLKDPGKYTSVGARIPKGVLLEGRPGTGKTLLAKAIAGEAKVPFFSISGSDFVEMFVGVGASRVRDLFENAKKNAPCIIFIDEIDAVARKRGTGMGGGHDEREQTLNQLLVEMDGFTANEGIIVLAATNRVDILDPAILRPGRFDRKITVGSPDVKGREDILKVHAKNKPLGDNVDLSRVAKTTAGFTGADLENLLNESAIRAAKNNRPYIMDEDIQASFIKVGVGSEKRSRVVSDEEKRITAYHEAGHAILFHVLPDMDPVYTVSIIPTGPSAAGYTMPLPQKDDMYLTRGKMRHDIMVSLGGRIAEELILDDITTGASSDIRRATEAARQMVTRYGFSENLGTINYETNQDEVFIGRDLAHTKGFSEQKTSEIDAEVKRIIDGCYTEAKEIILKHMDVLHAASALLLEKERITQEEFEALFPKEA